ncbi:MAG: acyl-CoA dehydrogenase family protein [Spirosomataceae bacterium]
MDSAEHSYQKSMRSDSFQSPDFYELDDLLTPEYKMIRETVRDFVKKEISPIIEDAAQKATFPQFLMPEMGKLGLLGPTVSPEYGGQGLDYIAYGLMMQEIERGDSGIRSAVSVQSSLVMFPIEQMGSEEQKRRFLPKLATGELIGCFGLTEPDHGSNPAGMTTHFVEDGDSIILNGSKMWISNAPVADVAVVWAKNEAGRVKGILVERGMKGFSTPEIHQKWSLRASATGELVFSDVRIPKSAILPGSDGLKSPFACLDKARYGIAWGGIGVAMDCYVTARNYALERQQFGKPIAAFQLVQKKLAEMLTEITKAQLLAFRLGQLMNMGKATSAQISMAKRNNVEMALTIAREARQILGGNGIVGDYPIMRHMANLESVITYEGTHDIHLLILGAEITGIQAFK